MGKGILLEVEDRFGVVLTPSGEFKRVPLPRGACTVGDEIAYQEARSPRWGWLVSAAAACLMLLSPFGYQQWSLAQPAALVMIDINPSVQLTINGREQVIAAEGLNADGEAVLEAIDWRKQPVDLVAREITAQAVAAGKLDPGAESSTVVVAVAPLGKRPLAEEDVQEVIALSQTAVEDEVRVQAAAVGEEPQTGVAVLEATADEVKLAHEYGLTLPKMLILEELQDEYPEVTPDQIRSVPPGQLLKRLGIKVSDVFNKAEDRNDREDDDAVEPSGKGRSNKSDDDDASEPPSSDKANSPGKSGESPGKSGDNPGKSDGNRGKWNGSPGKSGESPGKSGMNEDRSDQDRSDGEQGQSDDGQNQSDKEKEQSDKEKDQSDKEKGQSKRDGSDEKRDQSEGELGSSDTRPGYSTIDQKPGRSDKGDVDEGEEKEAGNKNSKSKVHNRPR